MPDRKFKGYACAHVLPKYTIHFVYGGRRKEGRKEGRKSGGGGWGWSGGSYGNRKVTDPAVQALYKEDRITSSGTTPDTAAI